MDTALWIVQGILAIAFLMAGGTKIFQPYEKIKEKMAYAEDFQPNQIKGIGVLEVLGAIGVILPWALDIVPILTPIAALGLLLVMIGAALTHMRRGNESQMIMVNIVLGLLAIFVAGGRF